MGGVGSVGGVGGVGGVGRRSHQLQEVSHPPCVTALKAIISIENKTGTNDLDFLPVQSFLR